MKYEIGRFVDSRAGHDKGERFIILEVIDENYSLIVDGKTRTLEKPKKKKHKHLIVLNRPIVEITTNCKIRKDISKSIVSNQMEV